jgi:hypothetical protein
MSYMHKIDIIFICIYPRGAVPQFTGGFHCAKICSGPASVTVACKGAVGFVWPAHIFTLSIYHFHRGYHSARSYQGEFTVERCWNPCKKEEEQQRKTAGRIVICTQPTIPFGARSGDCKFLLFSHPVDTVICSRSTCFACKERA